MKKELVALLKELEQRDTQERIKGLPSSVRMRNITPDVCIYLNIMIKAVKEKRILEEVSDNINTMLSKNKDFAKAQEKYQQFTKAYFEPIDKIKLFKSINTAGRVNDANTVGKLYRYMASDKITPRDIEKIAKSFAASGDKKQWRLIISSFFSTFLSFFFAFFSTFFTFFFTRLFFPLISIHIYINTKF